MTTVQQKLVISNLTLAKKLAKCKKKKCYFINYDELESAAFLGLVEAAVKYNSNLNDNFAAFATMRIIGAIKDYLRELAYGSRNFPLKRQELCTNYF